ncbi:hypothetical protein BJ170DRAFT_180418 [Xylariales sp. AK1849]|nr:hypothetical protein BJ170DRAFT_180418 [Xylariales sp. AK1849]
MLSQSLLVFVSALAVASASPLRRRCTNETATDPATTVTATAVTATLPVTGGTTDLPAANGTLKHIVVGHGIQNYTCSAEGANATSVGALAVLYDITSIYSSLTTEQRTNLPINVLRTTDLPLNLAGSDDTNEYAADVANPFKADANITIDGISEPLAVLGHHYFDTSLTPTFDLYAAGDLFKGGKLNGVKAPSTADPGLLNTGAVDWIQLGDKGASKGLTETYRVVTAGGNSKACTSAGQTISVPYASQYWYYE